MLIFRWTNCITAASGIITLCKRQCSMPVESGLQSTLNRHTVRPFTESDDTKCCSDTIFLLKMSMVLLETCLGL